ncbi:DUF1501 domain-containing protein [Frigoriglobus tundricola]|uniref:DUF1501 domain-containing protein n=1 Tax=Frigoriglobus tundricola TaxID=2774151 RepID=A0A6M5YRG9_9BACT|nr:DUF1501 domain-containing protein [Frigoriglobus tundricola]QJW95893.1 Protein of unknown function (DUF1501) [Frigoriglobus tundricola]
MTTRRDFLRGSSLLGFGATVPGFLGRTALAAPNADKPGAKDTVLVVVQLTGGNDGLNTVVPFTSPDYYKLRPTIAIAKDQVKKLTDDIGFHPAMGELAKLYTDEGAVCVVQGVGYPNPNQSHFRSMDIWHAASTAETLTEGWLGKALKKRPVPGFHLAGGNEVAPLALAGAPVRVPSVTSLDDFKLKTIGATGADTAAQKGVITAVADPKAPDPKAGTPNLLDFVARTQMNTYASSEKLASIGKNYTPKVPYPNSALANKLKLAAQLIDAGIGARLFYVSIDGFDTHAGQGGATGAHANLLTQVSESISAFYRDLAGRGHKDRVCVMTFSEFGRRSYENGSKGTDHGAGAPMLLVGGTVKAGVNGTHPSLTGLKEGNLVHGTDFRQVYAAVLEKWLGVDSKPIVGDGFKPVEVFA